MKEEAEANNEVVAKPINKKNEKYEPIKENRFGEYHFGGVYDDFEEEQKVQIVNQDGLRYPSIDELLEVVDSKYKLAYIAAKRAKIIKKTNHSSVENKCVKPVGKALEEILAKKVTAKFE
ncbi:MAG: DNA-directed RNA polymerase subunit omega [Candidatus Izimaplasma sp.]|nr:DNA-directed RNA polymerase subunit omega [Candidatus Izimaplasma bacterium]